jgi:hypothetical protein
MKPGETSRGAMARPCRSSISNYLIDLHREGVPGNQSGCRMVATFLTRGLARAQWP